MESRPELLCLRIETTEIPTRSDKPGSRRPICFFCHQEVEQELLLVLNNRLEEMACICAKHLD